MGYTRRVFGLRGLVGVWVCDGRGIDIEQVIFYLHFVHLILFEFSGLNFVWHYFVVSMADAIHMNGNVGTDGLGRDHMKFAFILLKQPVDYCLIFSYRNR